jgi:hypothetical protein
VLAPAIELLGCAVVVVVTHHSKNN